MERKYPNLCKPIRIGSVWYRNRMFSTSWAAHQKK